MTVLDAIKLFKHEMVNEITHSVSDDILQDTLFRALDNVETIIIQTYDAERNLKK